MPASGMHVSLIAALDRDFAIGKGNALPWHLPDDLKRFKALTLGRPVLMGRKTAQSLGGMQAVASLDEAIALAAGEGDELCVIGGGEVYALALPRATRLHLTHVDARVEGADAFFPRFDPRGWRETARSVHPADAAHAFAFDFVDYERA